MNSIISLLSSLKKKDNITKEEKIEIYKKIDFYTKYKLLEFPDLVRFCVEKVNISFDDNEYELIEIAVLEKRYESFVYLTSVYSNALKYIFSFGFSRKKENILNNGIQRMAPLYLYNKINDELMKTLILKQAPFLKKLLPVDELI